MPVSQFLKVHTDTANVAIMRFNEYNAMEIDGTNSASGSLGGALNTMMQLAAPISKGGNLPFGMTYEWSGIARQQVQSGPATIAIFAMGLLFVFLVLVAQYESMTTPFVIMLAVPLALLGASAASLSGAGQMSSRTSSIATPPDTRCRYRSYRAISTRRSATSC